MKIFNGTVFFMVLFPPFVLTGMKPTQISTLEGLYDYVNHECYRNQTKNSVDKIIEKVSSFISKHTSQMTRKIVIKDKMSDLVDILYNLHINHTYHSDITGKTYEKYNILKRCARQFIIACLSTNKTSQLFGKLLRYVTVMKLVDVNTIITSINNKRYHLIQDIVFSNRLDLLKVLLDNKDLYQLKLDVTTSDVPEPIMLAVQSNRPDFVRELLQAGADLTASNITVQDNQYRLDEYVQQEEPEIVCPEIKKMFKFAVSVLESTQKKNEQIKNINGTIIKYFYDNQNSPFIATELNNYLKEFPEDLAKKARPTFFHSAKKSLVDIALTSKFKKLILENLLKLAVKFNSTEIFQELKVAYDTVEIDTAIKEKYSQAYMAIKDDNHRSLAHLAVIYGSDDFFESKLPQISGSERDKYGLTPLDYVLINAKLTSSSLQSKKIMWFLNTWLVKFPLGLSRVKVKNIKIHPKEFLKRTVQLTNNIRVRLGEYIRMRGLQKIFLRTMLEVSWRYFLVQRIEAEKLRDFDLKLNRLELLRSACSDSSSISNFSSNDHYVDLLNSYALLKFYNKIRNQSKMSILDERSRYVKTGYKGELAEKVQREENRKASERAQFIKDLKAAQTVDHAALVIKRWKDKKYLFTVVELIKYVLTFVEPSNFNEQQFKNILLALSKSSFKIYFLRSQYVSFCRFFIKYALTVAEPRREFILGQLLETLQCSSVFLDVFDGLIRSKSVQEANKLLLTIDKLNLSILPYEKKVKDSRSKFKLDELLKTIETIKNQRYPMKKYPFLQTVPSEDFSVAMSYKIKSDKDKIQREAGMRYSFRAADGEIFEKVNLLHLAMLDGNASLIENIYFGSEYFDDLLKETNSLSQTPLQVGLLSALKHQQDAERYKNIKQSLAILLSLRLRAITVFNKDLYTWHSKHGYPIDIATHIEDVDILQFVLKLMDSHAHDWMQEPDPQDKKKSGSLMYWGSRLNPLHIAAKNNYPDHCEYLVEKTVEKNREKLYYDHCIQMYYWYDDSKKKYFPRPIFAHMTPRALALIMGKYKGLKTLVAMDVEDQKILKEGELYQGKDIKFTSMGKKLGSMSLVDLAKRELIDGLKEPFLGNYIRLAPWIRTYKYKIAQDINVYKHFYTSFLSDEKIKRKEKTFAAFLYRYPVGDAGWYGQIMQKALEENNQQIINVILCYAAAYLPYDEVIQVFNQYMQTIQMVSLIEALNFENFVKQPDQYEDPFKKMEESQQEVLFKQQNKLQEVKFYDLNLLHYAVKGNNFTLVQYLVDGMNFDTDIELKIKPALLSKNRLKITKNIIMKPLDFAQTDEMKEFLISRSKEFSLLAKLKKNPSMLKLSYIQDYYKKYPKKVFTDVHEGQTLLDLVVQIDGREDILVWLVKRAIDDNNKEYLQSMIPVVEKFLIAAYPAYDVPFTNLPLPITKTEEQAEGKSEQERIKVLEYVHSKGNKELEGVLQAYLKNRKPRVLEGVQEPEEQKVDGFEGLSGSLGSLERKLASLANALQVLGGSIKEPGIAPGSFIF